MTFQTKVLEALSEGIDPTFQPAFEEGCLAIMNFVPHQKDRATFVKLALPIYTRAVKIDPNQISRPNAVCEFIEGVEISVLLPTDMPIDDAAVWYQGMTERYLRESR